MIISIVEWAPAELWRRIAAALSSSSSAHNHVLMHGQHLSVKMYLISTLAQELETKCAPPKREAIKPGSTGFLIAFFIMSWVGGHAMRPFLGGEGTKKKKTPAMI